MKNGSYRMRLFENPSKKRMTVIHRLICSGERMTEYNATLLSRDHPRH
ncbi:MAG TPA: hypothetical protein VMT12_14690 [Syntrophales bacterium]|nr:hypothetical protein [Syntrophales bacterium]